RTFARNPMAREVYFFRPDSDRFDSIMIDASNVLPPLSALREGRDVDTRKLTFQYFEADRKGDFPSLDLLVPVLSQNSWRALRDVVSRYCRTYDLTIEGEAYVALSVHHIVDCLDKTVSKLEYFRVPALQDQILRVDELALLNDRIDGSPIFRIREIEGKGVYLS